MGDGPLDHALTFCDLTTGPDGAPVSLHWRVHEITERYGYDPDTTVAQPITMGVPEFERGLEESDLVRLFAVSE